jgi:hypothetical protein
MHIDVRKDVIEELLSEAADIAYAKGKAYSGDEDSLANFKRNGKVIGLSKYQILAIYMNKHLDSIMNAIKEHPEFPVDNTEGMKGRIQDAINYLSILWCLIQEDIWNEKKNLNTVPTSGI